MYIYYAYNFVICVYILLKKSPISLYIFFVEVHNDIEDKMNQLMIAERAPAARETATLRSTLKALFPDDLRAPSWINIHDVSAVFGIPKGLDLKRDKPLLWTEQMQNLWLELKVEPDGGKFRGQILAGPSGMGKSHIAFLLALRCFAAELPVLYVADAGKFYEQYRRQSQDLTDLPLLRLFLNTNADILSSSQEYRISSENTFLSYLNSVKAVVILDEHGHAYNAIIKAGHSPNMEFPLLMPNCYLSHFYIRCIFAGSNQARFESELNGTYHPYLRFITPFQRKEAELFLAKLEGGKFKIEDYDRYTNFVPREMVYLSTNSAENYVVERRRVMAAKLTEMADSLAQNPLAHASMVHTLNNLFHEASMAMGIEAYSFLDLGFVYRIGSTLYSVAVPLCYPATLALLDIWRSVSSKSNPMRLADTAIDGNTFKNYVWDVLLARGFCDELRLPCVSFGKITTTEVLLLRFNEYFISNHHYPSAKTETFTKMVKELQELSERCKSLELCILYRCPKNCADVDFFIILPNGRFYAIQTSISTLTIHGTSTIITIAEKFNINLDRYLFVTMKPIQHKGLAKNQLLSAMVRIVSAEDWIGK